MTARLPLVAIALAVTSAEAARPGRGPVELEGHASGSERPPVFEWPTERRRVSSRFRSRRGRHQGIDIAAYAGDPIHASAPGRVTFAGRSGAYGRVVIVEHRAGYESRYAHASRLLVRAGQAVRRGQVIARVGRSGNARGTHCHYEIRRHGRPLDPQALLREPAPIAARPTPAAMQRASR